MELKVVCDCGQKFKFEVEPVNGQMPFNIISVIVSVSMAYRIASA